jgi:hypothetical protein
MEGVAQHGRLIGLFLGVRGSRLRFGAHAFIFAFLDRGSILAVPIKPDRDSWLTFNAQSLLGGALLGQRKYAEAEPLLRKGYEGMKQREKSIPPQGAPRLPEAADRLISGVWGPGGPCPRSRGWKWLCIIRASR